jgi:hypothetical protein
VPDQFELLRRANDLVLDLKAVDCGYRNRGVFCQFDAATGWPKYTMKQGTGPLPDGICKIDETAMRSISVRQLLVPYE